MSGKRRTAASGAGTEIAGIVLFSIGFLLIVFACYTLGGFWLAAIPCGAALAWCGILMTVGGPPPGGTAGGTGTGTASGTPSGTDPKDDYTDPDADLPPDAYRRYRERD